MEQTTKFNKIHYVIYSFCVTLIIFLLTSFVKWNFTWVLNLFKDEESRAMFLATYFMKECLTAIFYFNSDDLKQSIWDKKV